MKIFQNFYLNTKYQLIILIILAFCLNVNTLSNEYAVDDNPMMAENSLVAKGVKGIPEILSTELFYGFKQNVNNLSEARYRPFSLVVFALEHQFFGANPIISHLTNILFFIFLIAALYKLLQTQLFQKQNQYLAFFSCLLFVAHPIHTEVIANVKSRDELITFLLITLSLISFIKYTETKSLIRLGIASTSFFLALLTRESAVTFIGIAPLILYFFYNQKFNKSLQFSIPLVAVFLAYMSLRISIIGIKNSMATEDILNFPFLYATATEAFATKIFILLKYLGLLIFPHPLSLDYGYNQIPYIKLFSLTSFISFIVLISLLVYAIWTLKRKNLISFCILYFMITISLVSNFVVDIGTPLSERLLFQPSFAFCIVLALFFLKAQKKRRVLANTILFIILILFSIKTYSRNAEWKNNETIYLADIITAPNSVRTNQYVTILYLSKAIADTNAQLKKEYFKKAIYYGERSLKIYPNNSGACQSMVTLYLTIADAEKNDQLKNEYFKKAIYYGERNLKINPNNSVAYMDLGSAYYGLSDYFKAADLLVQGYKLMPNDPIAEKWLNILSMVLYKQGFLLSLKGNTLQSIKCYKKSIELNNKNVEAWYKLGGSYFLLNETQNAIAAWQEVKLLDPSHKLNMSEF